MLLKDLCGSNFGGGIAKGIQNAQVCAIEQGWLNQLETLQEVTGIKPSERAVQRGYATYFKKGQLDLLRRLYELTGIKPSKKGYMAFIEPM